MSRRLCFALDLIDDAELITAYEAAHQPGAVWPEIIAGIRQAGYESMEIWRTADRLFMIAEIADDWPRALTPELSATDARWQKLMDRFQRPLPHGEPGEKWTPMSLIFALDDQ
ncbi:MAG TPA: L-rhamnose mutarotase [Sphingopyxis sp.]|nr:L-rhamnose mutarotase [Sphingopyxis sp.]